MTQYSRAKSIFFEAIEIHSPQAWPDFLAESCGDDLVLRHDVERLLRAHQEDDPYLDRGDAGFRLRFDPAALQPHLSQDEFLGMRIGPYQLVERLGEGGMGVVYRAMQTTPYERQVAIKVVRPGADSERSLARFEAERQALARMNHPHIAKIFDGGSCWQGRPYIVMELVDGLPINQYCESRGLALADRLELVARVCDAVQHAHQKGIIHRDLKPNNILITEVDGRPVPKVIDFGVSESFKLPGEQGKLQTLDGELIGTPEYMSPEQLEKRQGAADTRTDIYSLGIVLYELLTGRPPLDSARLRSMSWGEAIDFIRYDEPLPPSKVSSSQPSTPNLLRHSSKLAARELDCIVGKAIHKDATRRYATATDFGCDIRHHINGEPVWACPDTTVYRVSKFVNRHRQLVGAAILLTVLFGVCLVGTLGHIVTAKERAQESEALALRMAEDLRQQTQRANLQAASALAVNDFLTSILDTTESYYLPNDQVKIGQLLDRGIRTVQTQSFDDPRIEFHVNLSLAELCLQLNRQTEAAMLSEKLNELASVNFELTERDRIQSGKILAQVNHARGEFQAALGQANRLVQACDRYLPRNDSLRVELLGLKIDLLIHLDLREQAQRIVDQGLELLADPSFSSSTAGLLLNRHVLDLLNDQGSYLQGKKTGEELVQLLEMRLPDDDPRLILVRHSLGESLFMLGEYPEVEILADRNVRLAESRLGHLHPTTLMCWVDLALVWERRGQTAKAGDLLEALEPAVEEITGPIHPLTLKAKEALCRIYGQQGRADRAEVVLTQLIEKLADAENPQLKDSVFLRNTLSNILLSNGKIEEAIEVADAALAAAEQSLPPLHRETLTARSNRIQLDIMTGNVEKANAQLDELGNLIVKELGTQHPEYRMFLRSRCLLYLETDRVALALSEATKLVDLDREIFGDDHETTLRDQQLLGSTCFKAKDYARAIQLFEPLVEELSRQKSPTAPETLQAKANLGVNYVAAGRYQEGMAILKPLCDMKQFAWLKSTLEYADSQSTAAGAE